MKQTLDQTILTLVREQGFIRRREFNKELIKLFKEKSNEEVSLPTINKHVRDLVESRELYLIKKENLLRLGIIDKDKNACYLTLYKTAKEIPFNDKIFEFVLSGNDRERENALIELESLSTDVLLTPNQMDKLVEIVQKHPKFVNSILRLIKSNIDERSILPIDTDKLQKSLINHYKKNIKYSKGKKSHSDNQELLNIKAKIIYLLSLFDNKIILEWFKEDILKGSSYEILVDSGYLNGATARLMEDHKETLFDFSTNLDKGKSKVVLQFRYQWKQSTKNKILLEDMIRDKIKSRENKSKSAN